MTTPRRVSFSAWWQATKVAGQGPADRVIHATQLRRRIFAARVEIAAAGCVRGIGHFAFEDDAPLCITQQRIGLGHGREQGLGVGMLRLREKFIGRGQLHHLAHIHHCHPVADVFDDAQVVGDEEVGQVKLFLRSSSRLRIWARTETSSAETASSQITSRGFRRKGAGDADALAFAAAESMGIAPHVFGAQTDPAQQVGDPIFQLLRPWRSC